MNVLLTCAGRRCFLMEAFKAALAAHWRPGRLLACDCNVDAPALQCADQAFIVPPVSSGHYLETLLALCQDHAVGLLVPALEPELPLMAAHRDLFEKQGTLILISSPAVISTCNDKRATSGFLQECGLLAPPEVDSLESAHAALAKGHLRYPLLVKPRWGVSSIGVETAGNADELERTFQAAHRQIAQGFLAEVSAADPRHAVLIQQCLSGAEHGLDIINDLQGRHIATFVKRKLRMRAGLTDQAVSIHDPHLEELGRLIGQRLGHSGLLDADVFVTDSGTYVLDLNPRIGGGYAFSHLAGANFPAALLAWARGEQPDPQWLAMEAGVASSRCDRFLVTQRASHAPRSVTLTEPFSQSLPQPSYL